MDGNQLNVLVMKKDCETYVFMYPDEKRLLLLRTLGRFASNADLSFNWYDAAVLSKKVQDTSTK